jgi:hypothetical protein
MEMATQPITIRSRVPKGCVAAVSNAFVTALQRISANPETWKYLALLPRFLLSPPRKGVNFAAAIHQRLEFLVHRRYTELFQNATRKFSSREQEHAGFVVPEGSTGFPEIEIPGVPPGSELASAVDADSLPPAALDRAKRLLRAGLYSRAIRALSAAKIAETSDESLAIMRAKHPQAPPPADLPPPDSTLVPEMSNRKIKSALRSFPRGSSGGLSGLSADLLLTLLSAPGSRLIDALRPVLRMIAMGSIPEEARPFFFGARLVALLKSEGGLRPVAAGDVLRRLCSKVLLSFLAKDAERFFLARRQFAVGVKDGPDIITAVMREAATRTSTQDGLVIVKIDISNAFNAISRSKMLHTMAGQWPSLYPLLKAAYGQHSWLAFGNHIITSEEGTQQGDTLASISYSTLQAAATSALRSEHPLPSVLDVWQADDGHIFGPAADVAMFLEAFTKHADPLGLKVNRAKCRLYTRVEQFQEVGALFPGLPPPEDVQSICVLSRPVGSKANCDAVVASAAEAAIRKLRCIARLEDPHQILATLHFAGSFSLLAYMARATGWSPSLASVDDTQRQIIESFLGPMKDNEWTQATLPLSRGGFSLRPIAPFATTALAAATISTLSIAEEVTRMEHSLAFLEEKISTDPSLSSSHRAFLHRCQTGKVESVSSRKAQEPRKLQRALCAPIIDQMALDVRESASPHHRQLLDALHAKHSGSWIAPLPDPEEEEDLWLEPPEFVAIAKHRLDMIQAQEGAACALCRRVALDSKSTHSLSCMGSGERIRATNALRNMLAVIARESGVSVATEVCPFLTQPTYRLDVVISQGERRIGIDVAITNARLSNPDGYEDVKFRRYAEAASHERRFTLLPVIGTTACTWSKKSMVLFQEISMRTAARYDISYSKALGRTMVRLNRVVARNVGRILARNSVQQTPESHCPAG